jgi:hypothetical protein
MGNSRTYLGLCPWRLICPFIQCAFQPLERSRWSVGVSPTRHEHPLRWPRDFGQGDKLFPLERKTGRYGQGDTEALRS